jgi:hypothetical protein
LPSLGGALSESPDEVAQGKPFRERDLDDLQLSDWQERDRIAEASKSSHAHPTEHCKMRGHHCIHAPM